MIEMMIILFIVSSLSILILPLVRLPNIDDLIFANEYLIKQSECIKDNKQEEFESIVSAEYSYPIIFNYKGNVRMAQTIIIPGKSKKIVSQLGGGRLEFK